jgi:hypothetical protein
MFYFIADIRVILDKKIQIQDSKVMNTSLEKP